MHYISQLFWLRTKPPPKKQQQQNLNALPWMIDFHSYSVATVGVIMFAALELEVYSGASLLYGSSILLATAPARLLQLGSSHRIVPQLRHPRQVIRILLCIIQDIHKVPYCFIICYNFESNAMEWFLRSKLLILIPWYSSLGFKHHLRLCNHYMSASTERE